MIHRAWGQEAEDSGGVAPRFGPLGPVDPLGAAFAEEGLDDSILQGVKADDREPSAVRQPAAEDFQPAGQDTELVIDGDAQSLKDAGCRMPCPCPRDHRGDGGREIKGCAQRTVLAHRGDSRRDVYGSRLFAIFSEDPGQFGRTGRIHDVGRRLRVFAAHSHVKRAVLHQGEAPAGCVDLIRGDAQIEKRATHRRNAKLIENEA